MLACGLCKEEFSSNDDLRNHLEGHASKLFDSEEEQEENEVKSGRETDEESLVLDCVKEEEQLQGQHDGLQREEDCGESPSPAPAEAGEKRRTLSSSNDLNCSKCSYKSTSKIQFTAHMNQMHLNKFKCDHCPKRYPSKGRLANHIRKEHVNDEDKAILPEDEFLRITKKQGKRNIYECLKCTLKTEYRRDLYVHIRGVHKNLLNELYKAKGMVLDDAVYHKCSECFFKTLRIYNLKQHVKRVHQKIREFVCDLCKKAFSTKQHLIHHMKNIHVSTESY